MCGICGFNWNDKNLIHKMIDSLKHRGPDDFGSFLDYNISLGHTRLSIVDLSEKGKQPIHNEDGSIWIVFNGEIYNYLEIKSQLAVKGHIFYTNTDTEVIIHAYEEYGYYCLTQFNGFFALCIYDSNKKLLILARDRFGIKPLYYFHKDSQFIFASEIKSILKSGINKLINQTALREYFTYRYTLAPNTLYQEVSKLEPSHYLIFNLITNQKTIKEYYKININEDKSIYSNNVAQQLFNLLNDSVKIRTIAEVPVCSFLSGGIDSSIITGLASKFNRNINTYSVGFETSNEFKYARIVSEHFNTNHHELLISNEDILKNMSKMIYYMDEPICDAAFLPNLLISELVSKKFKVVLAGEGGDELFGGYDRYKMYYYGAKLSKYLPKINYHQEILNRISKFSKLNQFDGYMETIRVFTKEDTNKMKIKPIKARKYWCPKGNLFQKMQLFDIKTVLAEDFLMKADKMSSAYGLEERIPYMDYRVVSFAFNLPTKYKLNFWNEKYILKRTFTNFLPKIIIKRRKRGYNAPMNYWMKTILKNRFLDLLKYNNHNLYDREIAFNLFDRINRNIENYKINFLQSQKLWAIYIFEEWYKAFLND